MKNTPVNSEYIAWLSEIKRTIVSVRSRIALSANSELIKFYYELGGDILTRQETGNWGDKILERLSRDLRDDFPDIKGLSVTNLKYCRQFFSFYSNDNKNLTFESVIGQQPVDRIPWGHNIHIFTKSQDLNEATFYINKTLKNAWSRDTLALQIKTELHKRQGKAITNFDTTLPSPQSDLAQQTLKDPYRFDFMSMTTPYNERDIENKLVDHITKFLLELGKGFSFIGRQYHLEIGDSDYFIDLLFYHIKLRCYVVVELKNTKFIPEYAGKLNFYLSAVDTLLKSKNDNPTIGILLCRDKNNIETEFALRDINKPMGVSEFTLTEILPDELKGSLPTVEEIEEDMAKVTDFEQDLNKQIDETAKRFKDE